MTPADRPKYMSFLALVSADISLKFQLRLFLVKPWQTSIPA
jgi:hypothetical protein